MASNKREYSLIDLGALRDKKVVCLTLDIEQDYGDLLDTPCYEGLQHVPDLVSFFKEKSVPLTCFVQGSLLETHPAQVKQFSALDVDFELHSYSHPKPRQRIIEREIERGKEVYRKFFGKDPIGYRAPLGVINTHDYGILASHGFKFDSSIAPSVRLGVFNELLKPRQPYLMNNFNMVEFPITMFSGVVRVPMSLSYLKLFGKSWLMRIFSWPNFILFYFHIHDLFELDSASQLPLKGFNPIYRLIYTPLYRMIFRSIYQKQKGSGFTILDELITAFRQRGYTFYRLDDVYKSVMKQRER